MLSSSPDLTREEWAALRPTQKFVDTTNDHTYQVVDTEVHHGHTVIVASDETGEEFDLIYRSGFRLPPTSGTVAA